ncbi:DUF4192 domain-containing protein [Paractinoplanes rhizophilus]|uniref:DUF4192 domain-containing protein n=1 Tax=Paractinoplanes rhizophilus TaxID=1416877 RepID=A0ABW2HU53_9ACTN|nr:DUF4192 domain-containing protein [Actinoplanes sp.]
MALARSAGEATISGMNQHCSITASTPAEAVAVAPYLLGFHPTDSFVVLGLIGHTVDFAVRYDLPPPGPVDFDETAVLIARQGVERVLLLGYGSPRRVTSAVLQAGYSLRVAGVRIADVIRVADGRWWSYLGGPADGTPCAPGLAAEAVFQGMVALPDRKALVAKVAPVEGEARERVTAATGRARARATDLAAGDLKAGRSGSWMRRAGREAVRQAETAARAGRALGPDQVAWLGVLLVNQVVLDYAIDRSGPELWRLRLWNEVTRWVDPSLAAGPACLLAFAAWQAGDGSLARVAVDRALREDVGHRLAGTLDRLLAAGIRPRPLERLVPRPAPQGRSARSEGPDGAGAGAGTDVGAARGRSKRPGTGDGRRSGGRGTRRRSL